MLGNRRGQATLLVVVAVSLSLLGAMGLAVDGAQVYAHRTMAQAAADAAAEAGIMSIFNGTNTGANAFGASSFTCTTTDVRTPCSYARLNGFGSTAADTITVEFPTSAPGVNLSDSDPVNQIRVTIARAMPTSFMRLLGSNSITIKAAGTAAIVDVLAPVPILVLHPTKDGALSTSGDSTLRICGGANRSIQVNSSSATGSDFGGGSVTIDLSHAGKNDPGNCTTGTGADYGEHGTGPTSAPGTLLLGSTGKYIQPSAIISDPLASVPAPAQPLPAPAATALSAGTNGCPAVPAQPCKLYSPGLYTGSKFEVKNETAVFKPGIYYMDGVGFSNAANGIMLMSTGFTDDADTGQGMLVYITGSGTVDVGSNSSASLVGSLSAGTYKGILFFEDRNGPANTGNSGHRLGGNGNVTLQGTIYLTNTNMTASVYQNVRLRGGAGNQTLITGEIIVSTLDVGGNGTIQMNLNPDSTLHVRQVALVK